MFLDATYISAKKQGASMKPSKHKMTVLSQIFKLIPRNLIPKLANEFGIDRQSRVFSPTSHVLALVFGQLTHALKFQALSRLFRVSFVITLRFDP